MSFPDPDLVRRLRDENLFRLMLRLVRAERAELVQKLRDRGHEALQASWIGLLAHVDVEGSRITTLAEKTGVTRQAVSQQVVEIERCGYLSRQPDPEDGRGVVVVFTAAGERLLTDAIAVGAAVEKRYADHLGPRRFAQVAKALRELADIVDPSGMLGR